MFKSKEIKTPYYLIKEGDLLYNLNIIKSLREFSNVKILLATKCFATWSVFPLIKDYIDGTTSSSYFELLLGHQKFGKEKHIYSAGYKEEEIKKVNKIADKIIFNSIAQYKKFKPYIPSEKIALRINPEFSYSLYDLADPARPFCRLGEPSIKQIEKITPNIKGVMFHFNCDNNVFEALKNHLKQIEFFYKEIFKKVAWVSFGGGISFTSKGYPFEKLAVILKDLSTRYNIQVYLEPGEAVIHNAAQLITTVIDIVSNKEEKIAIIDASTEAHMPNLLLYKETPVIKGINNKSEGNRYIIAGNSCLAGDEFGTYYFKNPLKIGDKVIIEDAGGYTMVKKNWFNGLQMPSIVIEKFSGEKKLIRKFNYNDYKRSLS